MSGRFTDGTLDRTVKAALGAAGLLLLLALLVGVSVGWLIARKVDAGWFESVGTWVAAIFTGGGFVAAIYELRRGQKAQITEREEARREEDAHREEARREEQARREAMARAVAVKISWSKPAHASGASADSPEQDARTMLADVEVLNSGPYPISNAMLKIDADYPMGVVYGTIFPGEHDKHQWEVVRGDMPFSELNTGATLHFTDTYGNHWLRSTSDLVPADYPAPTC